jgi:hypothetical protein
MTAARRSRDLRERIDVRTPADIRDELDGAIRRRAELWEQLGRGAGQAASIELARLNARIADLWDEFRTARVRHRFGSPEPILQRAERDKRLERELNRTIEASGHSRRAA